MPQNRIAKLRRSQGWSHETLAGLVGVSPRTVHRWEVGETKHIAEAHLAKMCDLFGVSLAHLLGFGPEGDRNGEAQVA